MFAQTVKVVLIKFRVSVYHVIGHPTQPLKSSKKFVSEKYKFSNIFTMVMSVPRQNMEKCSKFAEINHKYIFVLILFENQFFQKIKHDFWSIFENFEIKSNI